MKKSDILKMSKEELIKARGELVLPLTKVSSNCSYCSNLANGLFCKGIRNTLSEKDYTKYWIWNVEVTKKEFDKVKEKLK